MGSSTAADNLVILIAATKHEGGALIARRTYFGVANKTARVEVDLYAPLTSTRTPAEFMVHFGYILENPSPDRMDALVWAVTGLSGDNQLALIVD